MPSGTKRELTEEQIVTIVKMRLERFPVKVIAFRLNIPTRSMITIIKRLKVEKPYSSQSQARRTRRYRNKLKARQLEQPSTIANNG